jgi:hypothetical protein
MSQVALKQMADRIADLLEQKMRIKGHDLSQKLSKGGHRLPRRVRDEAEKLAKMAELATNPKLMKQLDFAAASKAYDYCSRHLGRVGFLARYGLVFEDWALSILTILAVISALTLLVLRWRGFI